MIPIGIALLIVLLASDRGKGPSVNHAKDYSTEIWAPALAPHCALHGVPLAFALASIEEESGGNPCAIGEPGATGPDGAPREMGIMQLYNPDDLQKLGVTSSQLRAYCNPNKVQVRNRRGQLVWSHSQEVIRPLTAEEMATQAKATVDKILESYHEADKYATLAHVVWPRGGIDFWRLVKLNHGLPGLLHALVRVTYALGRAPLSWKEFRVAIESGNVTCDDATEAYRAEFSRTFDNAEHATAAMPGQAIA